mgnify:CR=1 FL=1
MREYHWTRVQSRVSGNFFSCFPSRLDSAILARALRAATSAGASAAASAQLPSDFRHRESRQRHRFRTPSVHADAMNPLGLANHSRSGSAPATEPTSGQQRRLCWSRQAPRPPGPLARSPATRPATRRPGPGPAADVIRPASPDSRSPSARLVPSHQLRQPAPSRRPAACKSLLERLPKVLLPSSLPGLPTLPAKVCYRPVPTGQCHDAVLPCSSKSSLLCYRCQDFGARGKGLGRRVPAPRGRRIALPAREAREGREARHDDEVDRPITIIIGHLAATPRDARDALAELPSSLWSTRRRPGPRLLSRHFLPLGERRPALAALLLTRQLDSCCGCPL